MAVGEFNNSIDLIFFGALHAQNFVCIQIQSSAKSGKCVERRQRNSFDITGNLLLANADFFRYRRLFHTALLDCLCQLFRNVLCCNHIAHSVFSLILHGIRVIMLDLHVLRVV